MHLLKRIIAAQDVSYFFLSELKFINVIGKRIFRETRSHKNRFFFLFTKSLEKPKKNLEKISC